MKPITPEEIIPVQLKEIPDSMIETVNQMLIDNFRNGRACIKQDDILDLFLKNNPQYERYEVFNKYWMDFEPVFRSAGWKVVYDKPAYNEDYPATFTFTKDKNKPND